jgi:hypothetical protein
MSSGKIININPELFSLSNYTKKKRNSPPKELKIKEPKKQSSRTMRNKLLHYIRKTQEENYRKFHGKEPEIQTTSHYYKEDPGFNNDFESSLKYLSEVAENAKNTIPKNYTLKMQPNNVEDNHLAPLTNKIDELPLQTIIPSEEKYSIARPSWGCLKGGALPTYRSWKNLTQKNQPEISVVNPSSSQSTHNMNISTPINTENIPFQQPIITDIQRDIIQKTQEKIQEPINKPKAYYNKRKKTIRRTYKVGKSKIAPKIGVLISNRTIRNTISTKKQNLKQIPIDQIRKTLIEKGFIKVGSIAPNDVLRQMYESMSLICGEVQNHNPDNLVYNFFNASS